MSEHHTFFNVITLPEGDDAPALAAWAAVGEYMEEQPGFIGSTLYRNRRNPKMLINQGRYDSVASFMASVKSPGFQERSQVLTELGVTRIAGLYDTVRDFGSGGS